MNSTKGSKRILFLGAGVFQLAGIRTAVDLGHHVVTLDNQPDSPGHAFSHQQVNCSTTDVDEAVRIAERQRIDAVFTMASDVAIPAQAGVAEHLSLPGPSRHVAEIFCAKERFRCFQREQGLPHPAFAEGAGVSDVLDRLPQGSEFLIVKPSDSSGSRGVARVDAGDGDALAAAFDLAARFSRSGVVCVEEHVAGEDVSVDGMVVAGEIILAGVTRKYKNGFAPIGHRLPGNLDEDAQAGALNALAMHFAAAGYTDGPFDADLRVIGDRCVVLEVSPRLGGNGVPLVVSRYLGVDLVEWAIRGALGEAVTPPPTGQSPRGCGSMLITSPRGGRIESINNAAAVRERVPELAELELAARPGQEVHRFRHGGDVLGYAIFDCADDGDAAYRATRAAIDDALDLRLVAGHAYS